MRVLLATHHLGLGGSESYLLTVAEELQRLGHRVCLYASEAGAMRPVAEARGIPVAFGDPGSTGGDPDAVIAQDIATSLELAARFPGAPQVFVAHSEVYDRQLPPAGAVGTTVVLNDRVRRRVEALDGTRRIVRLRQPIDIERFAPVVPPRAQLRRALLLGNYLEGARRELVERACDDAGLECTQVGVQTRPSTDPARAIADADIVIGYGRGVLEGMAGGRAAYVLDHLGGDGWVTAERYPDLESDGFGGRAERDGVDSERLHRDLAGYDPEMGLVNRDLVVASHRSAVHAQELVALLEAAAPPPAARSEKLIDMSHLVRLGWRSDDVLRGQIADLKRHAEELERDRQKLREDNQLLRDGHDDAQAKAGRLHEENAALRAEQSGHGEVPGRPSLDRVRTRLRRTRTR